MKTLIPLANGVEEMEAVIVADVLRRAGWPVTLAAVDPPPITAARGVRLLADASWEDIDPNAFDLLVLPGGAGGARRLSVHPGVQAAIRAFAAAEKWLAAICAGPLALQAAGALDGKQATCHPACAAALTAGPRRPERVVRDGNLITSQGPGTAFEFALALVAAGDGPAAAKRLAGEMVVSC